MTPDDLPVPDDDALAAATRGALGRLAGGDGVPAWDEVRGRARHVQRTRAAVAFAAVLLVVVGSAATVGALRGNGGRVGVAGAGAGHGGTTTTESTTSTSTTSSTTTTTTTVPPSAGPPPVGPPSSGTLPVTPDPSPQTVDFDGTIVAGSATAPVTSVFVGDTVDITATIRNISSRAIWASSVNEPTALATVCRGESPGTASLWWMTNLLIEPAASDGRGGQFVPTDAYVGTVTCELDVVTTDRRGTTFDTGAGGDEATAVVIAPVTGVAPVSFTVDALPSSTTSTTTTTTGAG